MSRPGFWDADWISLDQDPREDLGAFLFRLKLIGDGKARTLRVSADQRYRLYLDGRMIAHGPARADALHWPYDTVQIVLPEGPCVLHAVVWSFGRYAPMAQMTCRTGFILEGEGLSTPGGWEVCRLPGFDFAMLTSEMQPAYYVVGPGEIHSGFDYAAPPPDDLPWRTPNRIGPGKEQGSGGGDSLWWLTPRQIPMMMREPGPPHQTVAKGRRAASRPVRLEPGQDLLLDAGELLTAYPRLSFVAEAPCLVTLSYAESLYEEGSDAKGHRNETEGKEFRGPLDQLQAPAGSSVFEPLWWRTWRYLRIRAEAPVEITAVEALETGFPLQVEGSFSGDDPRVEPIWTASVRTLRRCMGETYFDCPFYEQLQYVGDTRIQAQIGRMLSRDRRLQDQALRHFADSILPSGLTQSRYPAREVQVIPGFTLEWIMMLHDKWLYDEESVDPGHLGLAEAALDACRRLGEDAYRSYWAFVDWAPEWPWGEAPGKSGSLIYRLHWRLAARALAQMTGKEPEQWPGEPEEETPSEHAWILRRLLGEEAGPKPASGPRAGFYWQRRLHQVDRGELYLDQLKPWTDQLALGLTTFVEHHEPTRSDCHAWSAHPILGFFERIAGITSTGPGWSRCRIAPSPEGLRSFRASIPHPKGEVIVDLKDGLLSVRCPVPYDLEWDGPWEELP